MNENVNLAQILKAFPEGTKLYSPVFGEVELVKVHNGWDYPIEVKLSNGTLDSFTKDGRIYMDYDGECMLFSSKDQRDWSKFKVKKPKFDSKTLEHFDRIIARIDKQGLWCCELFSFIQERTSLIRGCGEYYKHCMPYNDDTKHLVGTNKEAPEYYRYWED